MNAATDDLCPLGHPVRSHCPSPTCTWTLCSTCKKIFDRKGRSMDAPK